MDSNDAYLFEVEPAGTRVCTKCKTERPISMFYLGIEERLTAKVGRPIRRPCRFCQQAINNARMAPKRQYVDGLKAELGCTKCGHRDPEHPEVFDFDHLPGVVKSAGIAQLYTKGTFEDLLAEIAKCELLCGNCHRIRTHSERRTTNFGRDRGAEPGAKRNPTGRNGRN